MGDRKVSGRASESLPRNTESWRWEWDRNNDINENINNNDFHKNNQHNKINKTSNKTSNKNSINNFNNNLSQMMNEVSLNNMNPYKMQDPREGAFTTQRLKSTKMSKGRTLFEMKQLNHPLREHSPRDGDQVGEEQSSQHYQRYGSFNWEERHAQNARQYFANSFTRKKTRSASFNEDDDDEDEGRRLESLMSEPTVAFQMLLQQNKRQKIKLSKLQEKIFFYKTAELKNSAKNESITSHLVARNFDHLGCKLELLGNKIESRQLVVESLKQQFQQHPSQQQFHNFFDPKTLHQLFREQLLIDKVSCVVVLFNVSSFNILKSPNETIFSK